MNAQLDSSPHPGRSEGLAGPVPQWWLVAAGATIALLYLAGVVNAWWPTPDSALYHGLGRNLMEGKGYVFNGHPHTTVTPGLPVLLGVTELLAGQDAFWAKNLIMCLTGLASLAVAYATLRRMVEPRPAFAAVLAAALCYVYYDHSHLILTDAPFALLFWAVAYSARRMLNGSWAWAVAAAILSAGAVLIRLPGLALLGPLAVAVAVDKSPPSAEVGYRAGTGRRLVICGLILVSIVATAGAFYLVVRSVTNEPSLYIASYLTNPQRGLGFRAWQVALLAVKLPETTGHLFTGLHGPWIMLLGYPLLAVIGTGMTNLWRRGIRLPAVAVVLSVLTLVLVSNVNASRARYLMPLAPLFALGLIEGVATWAGWLRRRRGMEVTTRSLTRAMIVTAMVVGAVNAPWLLRSAFYYSYQGHRGRYLDVIEGGKYADLYATAEYVKSAVASGEKVYVRRDRVRMLHLLSGKFIEPLYWFGANNPWNATQADVVYRDLLARPTVDVVVHDPGGLDARYTDRLTELLSGTSGLLPARKVGRTRIYRRSGMIAPEAGPGRTGTPDATPSAR